MSFLKKLFESSQPYPSNTVHSYHCNQNIQPISTFLQKKFSRGIKYNVKILIRGDKNVGKSALLTRLKGEPFKRVYFPSPEIQVASVHWNHESGEDVIKVEVWDVVDKGKPRQLHADLNLDSQELPVHCLDATFLDVYKGGHGVIFVFNMTDFKTFEYIQRELPRVPPHLPVLVLANYRDLGVIRTIHRADVQNWLHKMFPCTRDGFQSHGLPSERSVPVQYCEASMLTGFGLRFFKAHMRPNQLSGLSSEALKQIHSTGSASIADRSVLSENRDISTTTNDRFNPLPVHTRVAKCMVIQVQDDVKHEEKNIVPSYSGPQNESLNASIQPILTTRDETEHQTTVEQRNREFVPTYKELHKVSHRPSKLSDKINVKTVSTDGELILDETDEDKNALERFLSDD